MHISDAIELSSRLEGWLSINEQRLLYSLAREVRPDQSIVELGAWQGKSTVMLAAGAISGGNKSSIFSVDYFSAIPTTDYGYASHLTGSSDYLEAFQRNLSKAHLAERVTPIRSHTGKAAETWTGPPIGLLFIDADHRYESVREDFLAWVRHCAGGSRVAFHDYGVKKHPGVLNFVNQLIAAQVIDDIQRGDSILHARLCVRDVRSISRRLVFHPVWRSRLRSLLTRGWERLARTVKRRMGIG